MTDRMATRHAICALSAAGRSKNEIDRTLKSGENDSNPNIEEEGGWQRTGTRYDRPKKDGFDAEGGCRTASKAAPTKSLRRVWFGSW